jgi:hypothetical protein
VGSRLLRWQCDSAAKLITRAWSRVIRTLAFGTGKHLDPVAQRGADGIWALAWPDPPPPTLPTPTPHTLPRRWLAAQNRGRFIADCIAARR